MEGVYKREIRFFGICFFCWLPGVASNFWGDFGATARWGARPRRTLKSQQSRLNFEVTPKQEIKSRKVGLHGGKYHRKATTKKHFKKQIKPEHKFQPRKDVDFQGGCQSINYST